MKKVMVLVACLMCLVLSCAQADYELYSGGGGDPVVIIPTAEETGEAANSEDMAYAYSVLSDGTARIDAYTGHAADLKIPAKLGDYRVTVIGRDAFADNASFKKLSIPSSVEIIEEGAFASCTEVISVTIPSRVRYIGKEAFRNCYGLKKVVIKDGVQAIDSRAFAYCENIKTVTLGNSIQYIGESAFEGCAALGIIDLPDDLVYVEDLAFADCKLARVTIPYGVLRVGASAFDCSSMVQATITSSVESIGANAFGTSGLLKLKVNRDTYAAEWAEQNGIKYGYQ